MKSEVKKVGEYLHDKVIEYNSRKWITHEKTEALLKVIKEATASDQDIRTSEQALKLVQKSLDKIKKRHDHQSSMNERLNTHQQPDASMVSDIPTIVSHSISEPQTQKIKYPDLGDKLRTQVKEYRAFNWISEKKANAYLKILNESKTMDTNTADHAFQLIQRSLQKVQYRFQVVPSETNNSQDASISFFTPSVSSLATNKIIISPDNITMQQLTSQDEYCNNTYDDAIANLFVEMCFFARLGFVQPPCCLKCAYNTTSESTHQSCQRYVTWRKDANSVLRPDNLHTNVMLVPCSVIPSLLNGDVVDGWKWDLEKKLFYQSHPIGKK